MSRSLRAAITGRGGVPSRGVRALQEWDDSDPSGYDRDPPALRRIRRDFFPYRSLRLLCTSLEWPREWAWRPEWENDWDAFLEKGVSIIDKFMLNGDLHSFGDEYRKLLTTIPPNAPYCDSPPGARADEIGWGDSVNGITHDEKYWYLSSVVRSGLAVPSINPFTGLQVGGAGSAILFKLERDFSFRRVTETRDDFYRPVLSRTIPEVGPDGRPLASEYCHYGDIDYHGGRLWVPIEHDECGAGSSRPNLIAVFDPETLQPVATYDLRPEWQVESPWVAVNPLNGLIYSSAFNTDHLNVYRLDDVTDRLELVGRIAIRDHVGRKRMLKKVQGATFSPCGHLYFSFDNGEGVRGFDILTGRMMAGFGVLYHKASTPDEVVGRAVGTYSDQEVEGLSMWKTRISDCGGVESQIHVILTENNASVYIKHFALTNTEDADLV